MKKPKNLWQLKKKIAKLEKQLRLERIQHRVVSNFQFGAIGASFVDKYNEVVKSRFEQRACGEKDIAIFIQNSMDSKNEKD